MAINMLLEPLTFKVIIIKYCNQKIKGNWIRKLLSPRDPLQKDAHILNINGWEKIFCVNGKENKAGVAILLTK